MVQHGDRVAARASTAQPFDCHVCKLKVNPGDMIVGFKNENKESRKSFDHVHERCADQYVPPALASSSDGSMLSRAASAVSGAVSRLTGGKRHASPASEVSPFKRAAAELQFSEEAAEQMLAEHGGNKELALRSMASAFSEATVAAALDSDGSEACMECAKSPPRVEDEGVLPPMPTPLPPFDSKAARAAVYDVFSTFIRPLLPKPQTDGSFKDGDAALLDMLMASPVTFAGPRAERLADLIKPEDGWDEPSLQRARSYFSLAAAGVQYLLFIPVITHRQQLSRHELFKVVDEDGKTVGVRDCCPCCWSNRFVNATDGSYNILQKSDQSRNGVRFIHTIDGNVVPISRTGICRSPTCPANVAKLQARKLTAPAPDKALPQGKAPDNKKWPSSSFSTHSKEYVSLIEEALPEVGVLYKRYLLLNEGGCDATLAARLMQTNTTVAQLVRTLMTEAGMREKGAMERYIAYMREQQLQLDDKLPQLPSPLELSRPSASASQPPTERAMAEQSAVSFGGALPATDTISNDIMRRMVDAMRSNRQQCEADAAAADDEAASNDEDERGTVTTVPTVAAPEGEHEAAADEATGTRITAGSLTAPPWLFVTGSSSILNVSDSNVKTIMKAIHAALKPYLTADLLRRHPGAFASHDHTFKLANRSLGDATAYSFMLGEDHTIFWHGAVRTTSWDELVPALEGCQRRFERLGVSGVLQYWWDDLCCRGKERVDEHVVVDIFPGVKRCPYKDGFHACQLVTSTFNAGTGEVDVWARDVGSAVRAMYEPDLKTATDLLESKEKLSSAEARSAAIKRYKGTGILRTYGPQPDELRKRWQALIERLTKDREMKGSSSIVCSEHGSRKGTLEQARDMFKCIDKGCWSDPPGVHVSRMYIPYRRHATYPELIHRVKKSESVKNETTHKASNRLVQDISRVRNLSLPTSDRYTI